jgi:hypothetical protein
MTVAFQIKNPFLPAHELSRGYKYRPPLITIWHVDPEKGGSDDSCDWFGSRRPLNAREQALADAIGELTHVLGNEPFYPDPRLYGREPHNYEVQDAPIKELRKARYEWARRRHRWHPRWHVWHWHLQIHPVQHFKRWVFSRCRGCGGRFRWAYAPVSGGWYGSGPKWFRNAEDVYHSECYSNRLQQPEEVQP